MTSRRLPDGTVNTGFLGLPGVEDRLSTDVLETVERRGAPVSLEEMTRRRDGWRQRWDQADRQVRAMRHQLRAVEKQVEAFEYRVLEAVRTESAALARAVGAEAQANRFALECGRLRDELAALRGEESG